MLQYTVKNLQFASTIEPDNEKIREKLSWAEQQRRAGLATIPSTIEEELEINPFMRVDLPEVQVNTCARFLKWFFPFLFSIKVQYKAGISILLESLLLFSSRKRLALNHPLWKPCVR